MKKVTILIALMVFAFLFFGCTPDSDARYNITYLGNGAKDGFPPIDNNKYAYGEEAIVLGKNTMVREGYDFKNWNTKSGGSGVEYEEGDTLTVNGAVFLYAIWIVLAE